MRLLLPLLCLAGFLRAEWLRTVDAPRASRELQTASRTFTLPDYPGRRVTLLGVSHIGSDAYYRAIQERLDAADLVLYEGIDGDREEFRDPAARSDPGLQSALARALGLRFQLDAIRYDRPHFRNSDLHALELLALLRGKDADALDAEALKKLEALLAALRAEGPAASVLGAMLDQVRERPSWRIGLRWSLAEVLGAVEGDLAANPALTPDLRRLLEILLRGRNDVVFRDLRSALARPQGPAHIVIFYGAAHMHDLEERLMREERAERVAEEWLPSFRGSLEASGLGRAEKAALRWFTEEQVKALRLFQTANPSQPR